VINTSTNLNGGGANQFRVRVAASFALFEKRGGLEKKERAGWPLSNKEAR
jgi:hypothetical protein